MCHFWSNFEIARLDFFRSKEYEDFFNMMDHSGGFWAERVSPPLPRFFLLQTIHPSTQTLILMFSGEMLPYIRLEQESFQPHLKSIISEIQGINIPISNIALPMLQRNNCHVRRLNMKPRTKRKGIGIPHVKAEWDADVNVLRIYLRWKIKMEVVLPIGFELQEDIQMTKTEENDNVC